MVKEERKRLRDRLHDLAVGGVAVFDGAGASAQELHAWRMVVSRVGDAIGKQFRTVTHGSTVYVLRVE